MSPALSRLAAFLIAANLIAPSWAGAYPLRMHHHAASGGGCGSDPGCLGAPAGGQILIANLVSSMAESGQVIQPLDWMVSCQDYACGPTAPRATAGDPLATGSYPAGSCDFATHGTAPNDYVLMTCNFGGFNWTFHDLDWGRRFGHGPVMLSFSNDVNGSVTFRNNWFENDPTSCAGPGIFINFQSGGANPATLIDFENNSVEGHDDVCRYVNGIGGLNLYSTLPKTLKYNYFHGISGRLLNIFGGNATPDTVRYNAIDGFNMAQTAHGEIGLFQSIGSNLLNVDWSYNVMNYSARSAVAGTASLFLSAGGGQPYGTFSLLYDLFLTNRTLGSTGTSGSLTAHTDTDPATGIPNRLTIDAISGGTFAPGSAVSLPGLGATVVAKLSGTGGVGSTYTISCNQDGACSGGLTTGAGGITYPTTTYSGSGSFENRVTAVACVHTGGFYQTINITHSRCDVTGSQFGQAWVTGKPVLPGGGTNGDDCVVKGTFAFDVDPVTLADQSAWTVNSPLNNC